MEIKDRTLIIGTSGKLDYLVIAEKGNVRLALKPILEDLVGVSFLGLSMLGMRLRSVPVGPGVGESKLVDAWPGLEFHAINNVRASTTTGGVVKKEDVATVELMKAFLTDKQIVSKFADWLVEKVGTEHMLLKKDELVAYILEVYSAIIEKHAPEEAFDNAAIAAGVNVFDLQVGALAKATDKNKLN